MTSKEFLKKLFSRYLLLHLLAMIVAVVLLCVVVHYGLNIYTHHGEAIKVPDLQGMSYERAASLLEQDGLLIAVGDSGYNRKMPPNCVLTQDPVAATMVKEGRTVYVTVNSPTSPTIALPDLVDNSSYREANARLKALGFRMLDPKIIEGEKDWVYGIESQGQRLSAGDQVSIERPLRLVIGAGYDEDELDMMMEYGDTTFVDDLDIDESIDLLEP